MKIRSLLLGLLCLLPLNSEAAELQLSKGWNLVSPLLDSQSINVTDWLNQAGLQPSDVTKIWEYREGWEFWAADNSGNLNDLKAGQGYWFLMASDKTANVQGQGGSGLTLSLSGQGWYLVGSNVNASVPISGSGGVLEPANFSSGTPESIVKIWEYGGTSGWKSWSPSEANPAIESLAPNQGYWVLSNSELSLNDGNADLADLLPPICPGCPPIQ